MDCKSCKFYTGKMGRCERFYGCDGEEPKATRNNPNPDYIPPMNRGKASDDTNLVPRMCPNCGAPVRGRECEYCGTVFSTGNDVNVVLDVDAVASAARRYNDSAKRTVRHFNPKTHQWEWVAENPAKAISSMVLPTKIERG